MTSWDRRTAFKSSTIALFWAAFLLLFIPFYGEILLAAVFAFAIEPFLGRLLQKRLLRWRTSVALILIGMFVLLSIPVTVVLYKTYATIVEISRVGLQNTPFFQKLVAIKAALVKFANEGMVRFGYSDQIDLSAFSEDGLARVANAILQFVTTTVSQVPNILLSIFVFCAALYFFLAESGPLKRIFQRQKLLTRDEGERFIEVLQRGSYNTIVSSMLIALMQASMVAVGSSLILQTGDFTVVWVVTFFCSFVPMIGAAPVSLVLAVGQLLMGEYGTAIGLVVVAGIAGAADNVVRPYLISSGEEDLHPVVSLLAIIGALIIFGMPGLFLGPVIATVAIKIVPTLTGEPEPAVTASGKD